MTLAELSHLEEIVAEGVRLRNKAARIETIKNLILELSVPLSGGVEKVVQIRITAIRAELRFLDLSNQSRNTALDVPLEDGRKLAVLLSDDYLTTHLELVREKIEALEAA